VKQASELFVLSVTKPLHQVAGVNNTVEESEKIKAVLVANDSVDKPQAQIE